MEARQAGSSVVRGLSAPHERSPWSLSCSIIRSPMTKGMTFLGPSP